MGVVPVHRERTENGYQELSGVGRILRDERLAPLCVGAADAGGAGAFSPTVAAATIAAPLIRVAMFFFIVVPLRLVGHCLDSSLRESGQTL